MIDVVVPIPDIVAFPDIDMTVVLDIAVADNNVVVVEVVEVVEVVAVVDIAVVGIAVVDSMVPHLEWPLHSAVHHSMLVVDYLQGLDVHHQKFL